MNFHRANLCIPLFGALGAITYASSAGATSCPNGAHCITVNNTCTLADAVQSAYNFQSGGAAVGSCGPNPGAASITIVVPAGTYSLPLGGSDGYVPVQAGVANLTVTVLGNGIGSTVLQGDSGDSPAIYVSDGGQLQNLTVQSSASLIDNVTGISIFNSDFTTAEELNGINVTGGFSQGVNIAGYWNLSTTVLITNSTITNTAQFCSGGTCSYYQGLLISGPAPDNPAPQQTTVTINNSTISKNAGGGIELFDANLFVNNSTISGNTSPYGGAGIAMYGGTLTMTGSVVENNVAGGYGGGSLLDADGDGNFSTAIISYSSITGNSALSGGGIAVFNGALYNGANSLGGLQWDTIATNHAVQGYGGGIWFGPNECSSCLGEAGVTGEHDTVVYNTSTSGGGGVYITGLNSPSNSGNVIWDGSIFAYNKTNNVADDYDGELRLLCEEYQDGGDSNLVQASMQSGGVAASAGWNCGPVDVGGIPIPPYLPNILDVSGDPLLNAVATAANGTQYYSPKVNSPATYPGGDIGAGTFLKSIGDTTDQIGDPAPANSKSQAGLHGLYYCLGSIESPLVPNGTYIVASVDSAKAIDDPGSSKTNGEDMQIYTVDNGTNQQWTVKNLGNDVITLTNVSSGQLLDVAGGSKAAQALVVQEPADGATHQEWNVVALGSGIYELTNVNSGLALDVAGGVTTNGTKIDQYAYGGKTWQQWTFTSH